MKNFLSYGFTGLRFLRARLFAWFLVCLVCAAPNLTRANFVEFFNDSGASACVGFWLQNGSVYEDGGSCGGGMFSVGAHSSVKVTGVGSGGEYVVIFDNSDSFGFFLSTWGYDVHWDGVHLPMGVEVNDLPAAFSWASNSIVSVSTVRFLNAGVGITCGTTKWSDLFGSYLDWEYFNTNTAYSVLSVVYTDVAGNRVGEESRNFPKVAYADYVPYCPSAFNAKRVKPIFSNTNYAGHASESTLQEVGTAIQQSVRDLGDAIRSDNPTFFLTNAAASWNSNAATISETAVSNVFGSGTFGLLGLGLSSMSGNEGVSAASSFNDSYTAVPGDFLVLTVPTFGTSTGPAAVAAGHTRSYDLNIRHNNLYVILSGLVRVLQAMLLSWWFLWGVYRLIENDMRAVMLTPQAVGNSEVDAKLLGFGVGTRAPAAMLNAGMAAVIIMGVPLVIAGFVGAMGGPSFVSGALHTPMGTIQGYVASVAGPNKPYLQWALLCLMDWMNVPFFGTLMVEFLILMFARDYVVYVASLAVRALTF